MGMLTGQQVADKLGASRMTVSRWQRDGVLPKPGEIKGGTHYWDELVIEAWKQQVAFCDSLARVMDEVANCRHADGDFKCAAKLAAQILRDLSIPLDERVRLGVKLREERWVLAFGKPTVAEQVHMIRLSKTLAEFRRGSRAIAAGDCKTAQETVERLLAEAEVPDASDTDS